MGVQTGLSEMGLREELGAMGSMSLPAALPWKLWLKKSFKPQVSVLQLPLEQPHALCLELAKGQGI